MQALMIAALSILLAQSSARAEEPTEVPIGSPLKNLSFKDTRFLVRSLDDFPRRKAFVLLVTDVGCPLVKRYLPVLTRLEIEYRKKDVQFIAINANRDDTIVEIADAMTDILEKAGFRVRRLGLEQDPAPLWAELHRRRPDVVFNLFEGNHDNTETECYVAGLLEWSGIPFTGSPHAALTLARAKHTVKHLFRGAGLPTAPFLVIDALPVPECDLSFPVIVKPAQQDGSVGVDQQSVGDFLVGFRGGEIGARRHADRLHRRAAAKLADLLHPRRSFTPVQLHEVRRQGVDDAPERVVVGVDAQRDDLRPSPRMSGKRARSRPVEMAGALGEKDESHHVRAGVERGVQGRGRRKAANFNYGRHLSASFGQTARPVKGRWKA